MYLPQSGATVTLWTSCVHAAVYPCKLVLMDLGKQRRPSTLIAAAASDFGKYTLVFRLLIGIISDKKKKHHPGSLLGVR